ncbi:MOSC N-terminal beta barrel domain-containing protein [Salinispirillum sp. LH 10-3-1]|uniref:MOSC N-terminal beta barrel domain-containing protein n=1 Tax=Salinispirillum sp. LH 10-3-1 TaxID=2952525 RepID=A0AB38YJR8_9GAMM
MSLLVSELWVYPVKGMAGNPVASLKFDEHGPLEDRRWMLMDSNGTFVSQRRFPLLGLFKASVLGQQLTIEAPDGERCIVTANQCTQRVRATVWSDEVAVLMAPEVMNQWLSNYFSEPVYLVRYRTDQPRHTSPEYSDRTVGFADGFPLLLCLADSLNALNVGSPVPLDMRRFRPNIVLSGAPAWSENSWLTLRGDHHLLTVVKPCTRCAVITIRPGTVEREPRVLRHLLQFSQWKKHPVFGQNAVVNECDKPLTLGSIFHAAMTDKPQAEPLPTTPA